jgi:DNA polymerase-1
MLLRPDLRNSVRDHRDLRTRSEGGRLRTRNPSRRFQLEFDQPAVRDAGSARIGWAAMSETPASSARRRLLLVDGHSLAYRAFYALPVENFTTTTGQPTNAVYGFTSMLINTLRDEQPTNVCVAFDVSRRTFRSEKYPEYKANRSASPPEFAGQVDLIREVLDAMAIQSVQLEGYEGDDIIATLARTGEVAGVDVFILSGDRDSLQLVDENITVLYPRKGVSDLSRMTPEAVADKYGVGPSQYADLAALVGDPSDNLPGVPGVGPGFASKWLNKFGSLSELLARADEITGKKGESLREHLDQVVLNRQLNGLVADLELEIRIEDTERLSFDRRRIHEVFDALQFRVLRERLFQDLDADVAEAEEVVDVEVTTLGPGQVSQWLSERTSHVGKVSPDAQGGEFIESEIPGELPETNGDSESNQKLFGVMCQGQWGRGTGELWSIAIAAPDGATAWIDLSETTGEDDTTIANWLADSEHPKAMHDAKDQMLAILARGWTLSGLVVDTALAAYLALPGQRSFDLTDLVARYLGRELSESSTGQLSLEGTDEGDASRVGTSARAVAELALVLTSELEQSGGLALLTDLEIPLAGVLAEMEATGIAVDVSELESLENEFGLRVRETEKRAHELAGREFNLGSPKQLQVILFEERGLPKTKKIKTGHTTDADALAKLSAQTDDPLLLELLNWRDVSRMRQTVAGLIPLADGESRIHTTFQQTIAATGRLSSKDPNLQNIPIRTQEGRRIRSAFCVGGGFESLLTADYSQIEMRIMAHLSRDAGLTAAFKSGEDLHSTVAARVFDCEPEDVDPEMRRRIKAMSYGLAYGLSAYGLSAQLGLSPREAEALMNDYFERFGGIRDYLSEVVEAARHTGYTETILGRRRYLPDLTSENRQRRQMAERMALNSPIQGSAADIIKVAMIDVRRSIAELGLRSRMLLQVHDELVVEVAPGELEDVTGVVRRQMIGAADLSVPLEVSVGVGRDWDLAAH